MTSTDRALAILKLFSQDKTVWSAEEAAGQVDVSVSQAYRYCNSLVKAGLLDPVPAGYILGPGFLEYDRLIRSTDPMIRAATPVMDELIERSPSGCMALLSRLYHNRVMCVHQVVGRGTQLRISFERGRPMPLLKGATSKIVLAYIDTRTLHRIYSRDEEEIAAANLGASWSDFKKIMKQFRRAGFCVARGEVDPGLVAVAVPIFGSNNEIVGSLTFVLPEFGRRGKNSRAAGSDWNCGGSRN